jgi:hypothetical protein
VLPFWQQNWLAVVDRKADLWSISRPGLLGLIDLLVGRTGPIATCCRMARSRNSVQGRHGALTVAVELESRTMERMIFFAMIATLGLSEAKERQRKMLMLTITVGMAAT